MGLMTESLEYAEADPGHDGPRLKHGKERVEEDASRWIHG
jgi:hypothetical protein